MGNDQSGQARDYLDRRLDELARFPTYAPFDQLYCRLVVAWSREAGGDAGPLRAACERLFDFEFWYHGAVVNLGRRERVTQDDLRSLADKRRINLTALAERLQVVNPRSPRAHVVRHLLLAECHYHLREMGAAVAELEAAVEAGGGHPLVHFALGYNRFDHAREAFSAAQLSEAADLQRAESEFRSGCFRAVEAFRNGLTGQAFDAQLHAWIGRTLAAAGLPDEATAALETAARIDPGIFGQPSVMGEPEGEAAETPEAASAEAADRGPEPITEEEVHRFGELLKRPWTLEDLLGEG